MDAIAGKLDGMFDFNDKHDWASKLILDPLTGLVVSDHDNDRR